MIYLAQNKIFHKNSIKFFQNKGFYFKSHYLNMRLNVRESKNFIEKIKPHILKMPKCMHYKIGLDKIKEININNQKKKYYHNYYKKKQKFLLKKTRGG